MLERRLTLAIALCSSVAIALACGAGDPAAPEATGALPEQVTVTVGDASFEAEVSETSAERSLGLGERDSLAPEAAMLFVFNDEAQHGFWMKGMRFPLDFVWISADRRVVALTENVPPPEPDTPTSDLELFDEDVETQYVLEVNAGTLERAGTEVGDVVAITPDIDPELAQ
jgi:uncharacterized protein